MTNFLLLFLILGSLSAQALGQDVEIRSTNADKGGMVEGRGQARLYSPRVSSGVNHQMMHFGKRLPAPPMRIPISLDIEYVHGEEQPLEQQSWLNWLNKESPVEYRIQPNFALSPLDSLRVAEEQLEQQYEANLRQQAMSRLGAQHKSQKLISVSEASNNSDDSAERTQNSSNQADDSLQQDINRDTRSSMQSIAAANKISRLLPEKFNHIWLSRLPGASSGFGSYNKKAEPKDNFFMHFGKKSGSVLMAAGAFSKMLLAAHA